MKRNFDIHKVVCDFDTSEIITSHLILMTRLGYCFFLIKICT